jgi:hypothetical protein
MSQSDDQHTALMHQHTALMHQHTALMRKLSFNPDDLEANRAGKMSDLQHWRLCVRRRRSIFTGMVITVLMVFIASLFIFMGQQEDGSTLLTMLGIGLALLNTAFMGIFARFWLRLSADIQEKRVQVTTGKLERVVKPINRRVLNYLIRVEEVEVVISKDAFDLFEHKTPYTLYTAPHTKMLLAAEREKE